MFYGNMNVFKLQWWSVNIGSVNALLPSGNKPLPEPMSTLIHELSFQQNM